VSEDNAINRVLRTHGLPSLDERGVVEALAWFVEDHQHFMELLRACEPSLRRDMYEDMKPHLRFTAKPLDEYIAAAKEHAMSAELPTVNAAGGLDPYALPTIVGIEVAEGATTILLVICFRCNKEAEFIGERLADAILLMRRAGWAYDESIAGRHLCPECLDALD
jgi:hypothetical protein